MHELLARHKSERTSNDQNNKPATVQDLHETEARIEKLMLVLFIELLKHESKGSFNFRVDLPVNKEKDKKMIEVVITTEQKVNVTVKPVTATGKPAAVDGAPVWVVSDGNATLAVADDGLSAFLISSDEPGTSTIVVSADADLSGEVETITDTISLVTKNANASSLGFSVGTPEPK